MRACLAKVALVAVIAGLVLVSATAARADSITFNLSANNLGLSGSIGTVTIAGNGANQVTVTILMNPGFSIKLEGGDVAFNGVSGLAAGSVSGLTAFSGAETFAGLNFKNFFVGKNISQFGTFDFDFANIKGAPHGVVSADKLTFVLNAPGLTAKQFTGVAIHFCTASGTQCGPQTGFASGMAVTPEPGTMTLLGSGLIGLAGLVRRRMRKQV